MYDCCWRKARNELCMIRDCKYAWEQKTGSTEDVVFAHLCDDFGSGSETHSRKLVLCCICSLEDEFQESLMPVKRCAISQCVKMTTLRYFFRLFDAVQCLAGCWKTNHPNSCSPLGNGTICLWAGTMRSRFTPWIEALQTESLRWDCSEGARFHLELFFLRLSLRAMGG